ncbi:MAG TPA: class I SAM-dependent methyltransferase [Pyrinomonadaceae bacterium]|nr:class I SAM-dependent methyltransferase [Pyrinomonadaceae bacterium]
MPSYSLNPYISFIESRLFPEFVQRAVFHRLTGMILEPGETVRGMLAATRSGSRTSISENDFNNQSGDRAQFIQLVQQEFLIPEGHDPLASLLNHYVARPIQNPAVAYRSTIGDWILVRTSMEHTVYSRKRDELPEIIEEKLSSLSAGILLMADGAKTLQQIFSALRGANGKSVLEDSEFRTAIDFLTSQERQLIKFTLQLEDLDHPFTYVNIVPRNLYHSERKDQPRPDSSTEAIIDFHLDGIEDANWEFDQIEPTVNHCFRFPHEALGGLDYGSRFCLSTLKPEVVPLMNSSPTLEVLEVGGGTGSFGRSFINQAAGLNATRINYHILDLSPALMENQRKILSGLLPESRHFQQNATEFDLPGHKFDLIISNEVIADFPVASVQKNEAGEVYGDGAYYMEKYDLWEKDAPDSFVVNSGAFRFIERAWKHLRPGGTLIVTEYGTEHKYPARSFNLNHDEFTIHFGHLAACAAKLGFQCRLLTLKEFLNFDDDVLVLNGREEHLLCLNHVFKNYGLVLDYAVISKSDFEKRCQRIVEETGLIGYSFSPLNTGYHFGPNIKDFLVLIMNKPPESTQEKEI